MDDETARQLGAAQTADGSPSEQDVPAAPGSTPADVAEPSFGLRWLLWVALAAALLLCVRFLLDPVVGRWATGVCEAPWARAIRASAVPLGGPIAPVAVSIALLVLARLWSWPQARRAALLLPIVFLVSGLVTHLIKIAVARPRPFVAFGEWTQETRWQRVFDGKFQSFPSGDVTVSAGLAMVGFLLVRRRRVGYLLFLVPAYSATARMVAARHYPSDCLAGFVVGAVTAWVLWRFQERRWPMGRNDEPRAGGAAARREGHDALSRKGAALGRRRSSPNCR